MKGIMEKKKNNNIEFNFSWFAIIIAIIIMAFVTAVLIFLYLKYDINILDFTGLHQNL